MRPRCGSPPQLSGFSPLQPLGPACVGYCLAAPANRYRNVYSATQLSVLHLHSRPRPIPCRQSVLGVEHYAGHGSRKRGSGNNLGGQ